MSPAINNCYTELQGNVWPGFRNSFARFIPLRFPEPSDARKWLKSLPPLTSARKLLDQVSSQQVPQPWVNLSVTAEGIRLLNENAYQELIGLAETLKAIRPFLVGGVPRSLKLLGDVPQNKNVPTDLMPTMVGRSSKPPEVLLTLSADDKSALQQLETTIVTEAKAIGCEYDVLDGVALGENGYDKEHFGFRDGVSRVKLKESKRSGDTFDSPQGNTEPGEFIIGLEREDRTDERQADERFWSSVPDWMKLGSFQVFRKLKQDVGGWEENAKQIASALLISPTQVQEQLVGREKTKSANDVPYQQPFAHVRKMRSQDPTRRILRRGIPYGTKGTADVGLLFNAYMSDIESQFEFLQTVWANNPDRPVQNGGRDAITGNKSPQVVDWSRPGFFSQVNLGSFVTTEGCIYAFVPAISTLGNWAN